MLTAIICNSDIVYSNVMRLMRSEEFNVTVITGSTVIVVTARDESMSNRTMYQKLVKYTEQGRVAIVDPQLYERQSNYSALEIMTREPNVVNSKTLHFKEDKYTGKLEDKEYTPQQIDDTCRWFNGLHPIQRKYLIDYYSATPNILTRCVSRLEMGQVLVDNIIVGE